MATGYTARIADGIGFNEFVWDCARAFGALITMRDSGRDAKIPAKFEISDYVRESVEKSSKELTRIANLTPAEVEAACEAEYRQNCEHRKETAERDAALRAKYQSMLDQVSAWKPPTPDHLNLRDFMRQQIEDSIRVDCGYDWPAPVKESSEEWLNKAMRRAHESLDRDRKRLAEETARIDERNAWVGALRESVPIP